MMATKMGCSRIVCLCPRMHILGHPCEGVFFTIKKFSMILPELASQYVYSREMKAFEEDGKKVWVVLARSEVFTSKPEVSGVVRVTDYLQSFSLMSDGAGGSKGNKCFQ